MLTPCVLWRPWCVFFSSPSGAQDTDYRPLDILSALTAEQRDWLKEHPVIRVGGPKSFPPFHYYNEKGEVLGMGPEYIRLLLGNLGIRVEYEKAVPWPQVLEKVKTGNLDVIACAALSKEREIFLNFSKAFLSFPLVILTRRNASFVGGLEDLQGKRVAFIKKVPTPGWLRNDGIEVSPFYVDTPLEALEAVSQGRAEAVIENLAAASYLINRNGLFDLKVAAPTDWGDYELHFAVRKDWPMLVSILNKALEQIPPERQTLIRHKWISVKYEFGVSPRKVAQWAGLTALPIALFVLLILLYNRRLKKEIRERIKAEKEREQVISELQQALSSIKQLKGLLPICSCCKKIRDDQGYWQQVEEYLTKHSEAEFSHGICPDCLKKLYPEQAEKILPPRAGK